MIPIKNKITFNQTNHYTSTNDVFCYLLHKLKYKIDYVGFFVYLKNLYFIKKDVFDFWISNLNPKELDYYIKKIAENYEKIDKVFSIYVKLRFFTSLIYINYKNGYVGGSEILINKMREYVDRLYYRMLDYLIMELEDTEKDLFLLDFVTKILINKNTYLPFLELNYSDSNWITEYMIDICKKNKHKIFKYLVYKGIININIRVDKEFENVPEVKGGNLARVFIFAAQNGSLDIIKFLLECGVDINSQTEESNALLAAIQNRKKEIIDFLIENKIDLKYRNKDGENFLMILTRYGNFEIFSFVIEKLNNIKKQQNELEKKGIKVEKYDVDYSFLIKNYNKENLLNYAIKSGDKQIFDYIFDKIPKSMILDLNKNKNVLEDAFREGNGYFFEKIYKNYPSLFKKEIIVLNININCYDTLKYVLENNIISLKIDKDKIFVNTIILEANNKIIENLLEDYSFKIHNADEEIKLKFKNKLINIINLLYDYEYRNYCSTTALTKVVNLNDIDILDNFIKICSFGTFGTSYCTTFSIQYSYEFKNTLLKIEKGNQYFNKDFYKKLLDFVKNNISNDIKNDFFGILFFGLMESSNFLKSIDIKNNKEDVEKNKINKENTEKFILFLLENYGNDINFLYCNENFKNFGRYYFLQAICFRNDLEQKEKIKIIKLIFDYLEKNNKEEIIKNVINERDIKGYYLAHFTDILLELKYDEVLEFIFDNYKKYIELDNKWWADKKIVYRSIKNFNPNLTEKLLLSINYDFTMEDKDDKNILHYTIYKIKEFYKKYNENDKEIKLKKFLEVLKILIDKSDLQTLTRLDVYNKKTTYYNLFNYLHDKLKYEDITEIASKIEERYKLLKNNTNIDYKELGIEDAINEMANKNQKLFNYLLNKK